MSARWRWFAWAFPVAVVVLHGVIMLPLSDPWQDWFISEYGPTEILSFACFGACAAVAALLLRRHWSAIPRVFRWMLVLFAAGAAFVAIEEISYGQTFWEYHTPAWFLEANHQREFNLHNLAGDAPSRLLRRVGEFGLPIFGLVLPLLWMRRGRGDAPGTIGFHVLPGLELVGAVAGSVLIRVIWWWRKGLDEMPEWTAGLSELQELIWAFAGLVWILEIRRRHEALPAGAGVPEVQRAGDADTAV